jgi:hypothetical protein
MTSTPSPAWRAETDADGIVWLSFDKPGTSTNVLSSETLAEFSSHLAGYEERHRRLESVRHLDTRPQRAALRDELARQHAAVRGINREVSVRRHRLIAGRPDQGAAALLVEFQLEDGGGFSGALEREPRAVLRLEDRQGEHRQVDVPVHAADVVACAGRGDVIHLPLHRRRRLQEELREPFGAVAHRLAVHLEHVAKLHPAIAGRCTDEQHVRLQIAPLTSRVKRKASLVDARDAAHVLPVGFLRHHADKRPLVRGDIVGGPIEELVEVRRLRERRNGSQENGENLEEFHRLSR